ncbi:MAG: hypothetical protein HKO59_03060 [Phycisphaerales bacterium]|nr:hypothetical protein [Phycisphaerales bacterium]
MTIAMVILSIIVVGMGSVMVLAARDLGGTQSDAVAASRTADVAEAIIRDVGFLSTITEQTDRAITLTVPDRDGDGNAETIRYAWESATGDPGVPGDPIWRTYNGGTPVAVIDAAQDFSLTYLTRVVRGDWIPVADESFNLLFVVPDPNDLDAGEILRRDLIESWGYTVTVIDDDAIPLEFDAAVAGNSVAYVCETVDPGRLGTKLTPADIGVVSEQREMAELLEVEAKETRDYGQTSVKVVDAGHYITALVSPGDLTIASSSVRLLRPDDALAPDAVFPISKHDDPTKGVLVTVEAGGTLDDATPAAGRRVVLPWGKDLDFSKLNATAHVLTKRSIDWAAGNESLGGSTFGYVDAFPTNVTNVRRLQVATQVTLAEAGTVTEVGAFIGGFADNCRFAIYSDLAGEPDTLLAETAAFAIESAYDWQSAALPPTHLTPGTYWLALAFAATTQGFFVDSGGELRYRNHWAEKNGFLPSWGASDDTFGVKMSIYAAYVTD